MYQEQRLNKILELLAEKRQLSAKEMVDYFHVSKDTIRRDFAILNERKLVQRKTNNKSSPSMIVAKNLPRKKEKLLKKRTN